MTVSAFFVSLPIQCDQLIAYLFMLQILVLLKKNQSLSSTMGISLNLQLTNG